MNLPRRSFATLAVLAALGQYTPALADETDQVRGAGRYQELTREELAALHEATLASAEALAGLAASGDSRTVCRNVTDSFGETRVVCDTTESSSSNQPVRMGPLNNLQSCLVGGLVGALVGSFWGGIGAGIGAAGGCAIGVVGNILLF